MIRVRCGWRSLLVWADVEGGEMGGGRVWGSVQVMQ